ncbi:MAG: 2-oxo acid dehydrogenase subunit E2 [candidate division Zixibacteria bacterium]|nr:2-oxo acid dehydrogenase subunit E2 [candidate division Zixibacteria bacterium]
MATEVIMPVLGLTMESGTIVEWIKQEGDAVREGEILFTVETDKSVMEVEAKASGVLLKVLHGPGDSVPIQKVIAYIGAAGEPVPGNGIAESGPALASTGFSKATAVPVAAKAAESFSGRVKASPKAKRRAEALGVSIERIVGTGPGGRVVFADVEGFAASAPAQVAAPVATGIAAVSAPLAASSKEKREIERIPLAGIRKVVATRLAASASTIPHFYLTIQIDMTAAVDLRQQLLAYGEGKGLARVSFNDMVIKAVAVALKAFPAVNASIEGDAIVRYGEVHVGFAVALEGGLVVPVVPNADAKSVFDIAATTRALDEKAKSKGLSPDDYGFGTFTVSNLGMFGVDQFTAIINPPEAAILAVGRICKEPAVVDDTVAIRSIMHITLSSDHRLIDGAVAAGFLARVKTALEQPLELLIQS